MSALKPAVETRRIDNEPIRREAAQTELRYLFSPYQRIDTRFDNAGFKEIEPCKIHLVDNNPIHERNPKRVEEAFGMGESSEPEFRPYIHKAGLILERLIAQHAMENSIPTGFCELTMLRGYDPAVDSERETLYQLQEMIVPVRYETVAEQSQYLKDYSIRIKQEDKSRKDNLFSKTYERIVQSFAQAVSWGMAECSRIKLDLAKGASGTPGYRSELSPNEKALHYWLGLELPEAASPLAKRDDKADLAGMIADALTRNQSANTAATVAAVLAAMKEQKGE